MSKLFTLGLYLLAIGLVLAQKEDTVTVTEAHGHEGNIHISQELHDEEKAILQEAKELAANQAATIRTVDDLTEDELAAMAKDEASRRDAEKEERQKYEGQEYTGKREDIDFPKGAIMFDAGPGYPKEKWLKGDELVMKCQKHCSEMSCHEITESVLDCGLCDKNASEAAGCNPGSFSPRNLVLYSERIRNLFDKQFVEQDTTIKKNDVRCESWCEDTPCAELKAKALNTAEECGSCDEHFLCHKGTMNELESKVLKDRESGMNTREVYEKYKGQYKDEL